MSENMNQGSASCHYPGRAALRKAYYCNLITAFLVLLSVIWMFSGFSLGKGSGSFSDADWSMFKYYTIDSNVLMGIVALIAALAQGSVLRGKSNAVVPFLYALKLMGVVGVTLTMLVTLFFLVPTTSGGFAFCYSDSNFFFHLIIPLLSIFTFLAFERSNAIARKHTFTGIVSMIIYGICYSINCILTAVDNVVPMSSDWYGFCRGGLKSGLLLFPLLILCTYGISFLLWKLNRIGTNK